MLKIFIVAGEESGDRLGAALMAAITTQAAQSAVFEGVGGNAMTEQGLASRFAIDELAINGFVAVAARLPNIIRRIRETAAAVVAAQPDALVIIDSPDFTHQVARRVRERSPGIPIINYVSPTIWAWRAGRAAAMRRYVDHVLALLPFEPEAHRRLGGPPCTFVGHPLAEVVAVLRPDPDERARREAAPPTVLVLPGSRRGEINRHLAAFGAAIDIVRQRVGAVRVVLPTVPYLFDHLVRDTASWTAPPQIVVDPPAKWAAFRQARAALAASGTVTLELALAGVPSVIAYKVALVEELIARMLATTRTVGLANIILGEIVMPELLQRDATPRRLAEALLAIIGDTPARRRQLDALARLDAVMQIGKAEPSARAAAIVLDLAVRSHLRDQST